MTIATSFNLARRDSVKNEPDLLQEDYTSTAGYTHTSCSIILDMLRHGKQLPVECNRFDDIKAAYERKLASRSIAFQGVSPGEVGKAKLARRMTSGASRRKLG